MLHAIVRAVSPALSRCLLTHLTREAIDLDKATAQHRDYVEALRDAGAEVEVLPAVADLPDAVFVEDAAIVLEEIGVITRPGAVERRDETPSVARALAKYRPIEHLQAPATMDGGDVLCIGRHLYVGLTHRTNVDGVEQLARIVEPFGYEVVAVPVAGCLHLKTGVSYLGKNTVLINPIWLGVADFRRHHQITVADDEPFAANALLVGDQLFVSRHARKTQRLMEQQGFSALALDISELEKAEAGLTCLSLLCNARVGKEGV